MITLQTLQQSVTDFDWFNYLVREFPVLLVLGYIVHRLLKRLEAKEILQEKYFERMTEITGVIKGFESYIENIEKQSEKRDQALVDALNNLSKLITEKLLNK